MFKEGAGNVIWLATRVTYNTFIANRNSANELKTLHYECFLSDYLQKSHGFTPCVNVEAAVNWLFSITSNVF